jgi:hypothetical protein
MKFQWKLKPFFTTRRKSYELLVLLGLNGGLYFLWSSFAILMLFNLGFVWNWAASQEVGYVLESRRYRFSLLKMVYNSQTLILMPFKKFHPAFSFIPKILPAGLFWLLVIHFAGSDLVWWPTFLGSLVFELTQLDSFFVSSASVAEIPPALPDERIP